MTAPPARGYAAFEHLDDYRTPVRTVIAAPVLLAAPSSGAGGAGGAAAAWEAADAHHRHVPQCPDLRRWPPRDAPWLVGCALDAHCDWLVRAVPGAVAAYARRFAALHAGALPALGHLHFLYNAAVPPSGGRAPWRHEDDPEPGAEDADVCLPSDLCVCDCPCTPAAEGAAAPEGGVEGSVRLMAWCLVAAGDDADAAGALATPPDDRTVAWLRALRDAVGVDCDLQPATVAFAKQAP